MDELLNNYFKDHENLKKTINDFKILILPIYKNEYPFHMLSYCRLKRMCCKLEKLHLIPSYDEFAMINSTHELFDADMEFRFLANGKTITLKIPFIIDITLLSKYLNKHKYPIKRFQIDQLRQIIHPDYFQEANKSTFFVGIKHDLLRKDKTSNPVIIMDADMICDFFVINGNHRTIASIRLGEQFIEGHIVTPQMCSHFGLTRDYHELYKMIAKLYRVVHGAYVDN